MSPQVTMQLALAAPLLGTVLIVLTGHRPNLRETVTLVTAAVMFLLVASLVPEVMAGGRPEVVFGNMLPGLPIALKLEPLGMTFALIASFLWIVTSIYAIGYMRGHHEQNQTQFYAFFAIALFSAVFVAFSGNLLTLFLAYEILSVSTYPLVTHHRTPEAKRGGRVYLGILLTTSIGFFLFAIVWTWLAAGTLDFTDGGILSGKVSDTVAGVLLALYVFGIGKAAVMPFHRWLPAAMVAPTPVSALLHAVAVVKAGVFSVVKVVVYIFGVDFLHSLAASEWLQYAAAATILLASLVAMTKDNLKARLAYSTVSQLSYIVLGAMLATEISVVGGGMHIAMHAFGKITLFFCAGAILVAAHKTEISQMRGIGRVMPITTFAFLIGSLSIIGLPPFGGMWSKWYLALGALDAGKQIMVAVLMVSSLLNIAYLLPIPIRGFFSEPDDNPGHGAGVHEAPWPCVLALSVSAVGCIVLFFFPEPVYNLLAGMFAR
jgi:multicomponent Na+:H+ antiporter subunit D